MNTSRLANTVQMPNGQNFGKAQSMQVQRPGKNNLGDQSEEQPTHQFSVFKTASLNGGARNQVFLVDPDWVSPCAKSYSLKVGSMVVRNHHGKGAGESPSHASQHSTECPSESQSRTSSAGNSPEKGQTDAGITSGNVSGLVNSHDLENAGGTQSLCMDPAELANSQENKRLAERWRARMESNVAKEQFLIMLRKLKIFKACTSDFLRALVFKFQPIVYRDGQIIIAQGDIEDYMVICLSGSAKILVHFKNMSHSDSFSSVKVGELKPGNFLGELAALGISLRRTATVQAQEECTALILSRTALHEALDAVTQEVNTFDSLLDFPLHLDEHKLSNNKYFSNLNPGFLAQLQTQLELRLFVTGERIMKEGDYGEQMFILQHGKVSVIKNGNVICVLEDGAMLGEMAVLGSDKKRSATVVCKTWCVFQVLRGEVFHQLLDQYPGDQAKFDHFFITRLVAIDLPKVSKERKHLDHFYGAIHPNAPDGSPGDLKSQDSQKPQGSPQGSQATTSGSRSLSKFSTTQSERANMGPSALPKLAGIISTVTVNRGDHD